MPVRQTEVLSPGAFVILTSLRLGPRHGYAIIRDVTERSGGRFRLSASTVYPRLHSLERSKLVRKVHATALGGGRRAVYQITMAGRQALAREAARLLLLRSLSAECTV